MDGAKQSSMSQSQPEAKKVSKIKQMRINKRTLRKQKELLRELERKSKEAREAA